MRLFTTALCCLLASLSINAQSGTPWEQCVQNYQLQQLFEINPAHEQAIRSTFSDAARFNQENHSRTENAVYRIPVVFHVVWNTAEQNLSDELIQAQLDRLNADFRRTNDDADNVRAEFLPVVGDTRIEFYLAETDPTGSPTTGITHTQTDVATFADLGFDIEELISQLETECGISIIDLVGGGMLTPAQEECLNEIIAGVGGGGGEMAGLFDGVKASATGGVDPWPVSDYVNIWVCNLSIANPLGGGEQIDAVLGFAYPPTSAPNWPDGTVPGNVEDIDGIVIHYRAIGPGNPAAGSLNGVADLGRTTVHEMGHYLGIRHIWGDGDCSMDDGINDTPLMADQSQSDCDQTKNSCVDPGTDLPDMIENYMDYSNDACSNSWTNGQSAIMRSMLETARAGLLQTIGADFFADKTEVEVDEEILFSTSSLVNTIDLNWDFGDDNTATGENATHSYDADGFYTVTLTASNPNNDVDIQRVDYIQVGDPAASGLQDINSLSGASIYPNPTSGMLYLEGIAGSISISTISGQIIYSVNERSDASAYGLPGLVSNEQQTIKIDLSEQPAGIYFLQVENIEGKFVSRVVVD